MPLFYICQFLSLGLWEIMSFNFIEYIFYVLRYYLVFLLSCGILGKSSRYMFEFLECYSFSLLSDYIFKCLSSVSEMLPLTVCFIQLAYYYTYTISFIKFDSVFVFILQLLTIPFTLLTFLGKFYIFLNFINLF